MVGPMIINPQHLYFTKTSDAYLVTHTPGFMAKICAHGHLSSLKYQTGWDALQIETFEDCDPLLQMYAAGVVEGALMSKQMEEFYDNLGPIDDNILQNIKKIHSNIARNVTQHVEYPDHQEGVYRGMVKLIHYQMEGLHKGYSQYGNKLRLEDLYFLNADGQISEYEQIFERAKDYKNLIKFKMTSQKHDWVESLMSRYKVHNIKGLWDEILKQSHCSAMVKKIDNDVYFAHATFDNYNAMIRTMKHYDFQFSGKDGLLKPSQVTFSSYPGPITSQDDYYMIKNHILVMETTTSVLDDRQYNKVLPMESYIPDFYRISIANHLSNSNREWYDNFSYINTGTYNSQWMILDYDHVNDPQNLLLVAEQAPGLSMVKDMTKVLYQDTYWASFNVPSFPEVQKALGYDEIRTRFIGESEEFGYESNSRGIYFQKHNKEIKDLESMKIFMQTDPISPRNDRSEFGSIDTKITNTTMVKQGAFIAIGGPPRDGTPFNWGGSSTTHKGIPEIFNFNWVSVKPDYLNLIHPLYY